MRRAGILSAVVSVEDDLLRKYGDEELLSEVVADRERRRRTRTITRVADLSIYRDASVFLERFMQHVFHILNTVPPPAGHFGPAEPGAGKHRMHCSAACRADPSRAPFD